MEKTDDKELLPPSSIISDGMVKLMVNNLIDGLNGLNENKVNPLAEESSWYPISKVETVDIRNLSTSLHNHVDLYYEPQLDIEDDCEMENGMEWNDFAIKNEELDIKGEELEKTSHVDLNPEQNVNIEDEKGETSKVCEIENGIEWNDFRTKNKELDINGKKLIVLLKNCK